MKQELLHLGMAGLRKTLEDLNCLRRRFETSLAAAGKKLPRTEALSQRSRQLRKIQDFGTNPGNLRRNLCRAGQPSWLCIVVPKQPRKSGRIDANRVNALSQSLPSLVLREPLSRGIAAHDEMPTFALAGPEIDTVVACINSLSATKAEPIAQSVA
jgi:hypothetical protein